MEQERIKHELNLQLLSDYFFWYSAGELEVWSSSIRSNTFPEYGYNCFKQLLQNDEFQSLNERIVLNLFSIAMYCCYRNLTYKGIEPKFQTYKGKINEIKPFINFVESNNITKIRFFGKNFQTTKKGAVNLENKALLDFIVNSIKKNIIAYDDSQAIRLEADDIVIAKWLLEKSPLESTIAESIRSKGRPHSDKLEIVRLIKNGIQKYFASEPDLVILDTGQQSHLGMLLLVFGRFYKDSESYEQYAEEKERSPKGNPFDSYRDYLNITWNQL